MRLIDSLKRGVGSSVRPRRAGDSKVGVHRVEVRSARVITVESAAFPEGEAIPRRYAGDGDNVSPPLAWGALPEGTRELVVLCEDPDAPTPTPYAHWVLYGLPPEVHQLPEDVQMTPELSAMGAHQGVNGQRDMGWMGPLPPRGHGVHHYHFEVFALDAPLTLGERPTRDDVVYAMRGHVLGCGETIGTYARD